MEIILIGLIIIFIISYRTKKGESVYKCISEQAVNTYKKREPYSFKIMREKVKELGLEYILDENGNHIFTTHVGALTAEQMKSMLKEMGLNE